MDIWLSFDGCTATELKLIQYKVHFEVQDDKQEEFRDCTPLLFSSPIHDKRCDYSVYRNDIDFCIDVRTMEAFGDKFLDIWLHRDFKKKNEGEGEKQNEKIDEKNL